MKRRKTMLFIPPVMQVCNNSTVTPFKIVAKNEERGQPQASYLRYVKVYLPGETVVELQKSRRVLVKKQPFLDFCQTEQIRGGNQRMR